MFTLVYAYYDNPTMLKEQLDQWERWTPGVKMMTEVIITDDCSPRWPAKIRDVGISMKLFRIEKDIPWNWLECRNIGAKHAANPWLLLTDMDHRVPMETLIRIHAGIEMGWISDQMFYTMDRVDAPNMTPYKFHPDSYLMTKEFFWKVGGYDEHFAGHYGTSGIWRQRCMQVGEKGHLPNTYLIRYDGNYMPDARTTTLARKEGRDPNTIKTIAKRLRERGITAPRNFAQPYHLVQEINP